MNKLNKEWDLDLDDIFEDMNSYTGEKLRDDELFDRIKQFISSLLKEKDEKIVELMTDLEDTQWKLAKQEDKFKAVAEKIVGTTTKCCLCGTHPGECSCSAYNYKRKEAIEIFKKHNIIKED